MANMTNVAVDRIPGRVAVGLLRRVAEAFEQAFAELGREIAIAREDLRWRRALQGFDQERLRDLGLDRDAC